MKAVSLLSGGLDSAVATAVSARAFSIDIAVTFDYGQRAVKKEIEASRRLCKHLKIDHRVIGLPWLAETTRTALVDRSVDVPCSTPQSLGDSAHERASQVWVPNRNGVFVAIAASLAESMNCSAVIAGFNSEEAASFPDNSKEFINAANSVLEYSTLNKVAIECPTASLTKESIASHYISMGLPLEALWCCYHGGKKLCGKCESCARSIRAFKAIKKWNEVQKMFATNCSQESMICEWYES